MTNLTELEEAYMPDQPEDAEEPAEATDPNEPEKADEADEFEYMPPDNGDHQLRALVDLINKTDAHGLGVGVTLHVGGGLVSGALVSIKAYTAGVAEALRASDADSPINDAVAQFFEAWAGEWKGDDLEAEHPDEWLNTRHVHLHDAVVREPSGKGGLRTPWWRGRIGAVAGWTLGTWDEPPVSAGHLTFGV